MKKIAVIFSLAAGLLGLEFSEIKSQIKTQYISGDFAQTKFLSGFNAEFKSYGKFELSQSELLYDTLSPVAVSIVINERGIFQKSGNQLIKIDQNFDKKLYLSSSSIKPSLRRNLSLKSLAIKATGISS